MGRTERGGSKCFVNLNHTKKICYNDQKRIAVLHGTLELHSVSDLSSFTMELYKLYKKHKNSIPILDIPRMINQKWESKGFPQRCKLDCLEVGSFWKDFQWPAPADNPTITSNEEEEEHRNTVKEASSIETHQQGLEPSHPEYSKDSLVF